MAARGDGGHVGRPRRRVPAVARLRRRAVCSRSRSTPSSSATSSRSTPPSGQRRAPTRSSSPPPTAARRRSSTSSTAVSCSWSRASRRLTRWCDERPPRRGVDPHRIRATAPLRRRSRGAACPTSRRSSASDACSSSRRRAEPQSDDGARIVKLLGRSLASTFSEVRSHVPTHRSSKPRCSRRGATRSTASSASVVARARTSARRCSYFTEQEAGTPGASYADRPALPHIAIPTTYSGAELTPFFGMTDERTHTKAGGGGPTTAPIAVDVRPAAHASTPRPRERRDRHERARPLRRGRVLPAPHARGRSDRGWRASGASLARCLPSWTIPTTSTRRTDALAGAALAGRCLAERDDGRPSRPRPARRRAHRHPARPRERSDPRCTRCASTQMLLPTRCS